MYAVLYMYVTDMSAVLRALQNLALAARKAQRYGGAVLHAGGVRGGVDQGERGGAFSRRR